MIRRTAIALLLWTGIAASAAAAEPPVRITTQPRGIVHGTFHLPVSVDENVAQVELFVNGVHFGTRTGRSMIFEVPIGEYVRRLRFRAVGYDASGSRVGEADLVVNDPQPPFRLRLSAPEVLPEEGMVDLTANIVAPPNIAVESVDFWVDETKIGTSASPPWRASFERAELGDVLYARATARARGGLEASNVFFWGDGMNESIEVNLHQIPLSIVGRPRPLSLDDLELIDLGVPRPIDRLVRASDQPLNVVILLDSSESMLDEVEMVKRAAREFARSVIGPNDRIALVAFAERRVWLTPFTSDLAMIDRAVEHMRPRGETHLYDAVIEMLFELQKMPGRKALVVLTDGVNQGGNFKLDHVVHYARYSGVPIYPVIRNKWVQRASRLKLHLMEAQKFGDMARESGASYFIVGKPSELPSVYARIAAELNSQYLVMFYASSTGRDEWHSIAIRPRKPGLAFRHPRGYFP
jgi:VWFA-related protein